MKKYIKTAAVLLYLMVMLSAVTLGASAAYKAGDSIEFGSYPQSEVTLLNNAKAYLGLKSVSPEWKNYGYYYLDTSVSPAVVTSSVVLTQYADVKYDGELYRGVKLVKYRPDSTLATASASTSYQDDNGYTTSNTYWFRYEPIKWTVIDNSGVLMADDLLDARCFNQLVFMLNNQMWTDRDGTKAANIYNDSDIRAFLNESFLDTAFSAEEKTALTEDSKYLNGEDLVSLASQSYGNLFTGLLKIASAKAAPTDYAKCLGIKVGSSGNSNYYLKDAGIDSAHSTMILDSGTETGVGDQVNTVDGVRPVIKLKSLDVFTLKYDMNGGKGSVADESGFGKTDFTVTSFVPTRDGYDFLGWATGAYATAGKYTAGSTITVKDSVTTLYAVWQPKTYTVTLNPNGGSCATSTLTVKYGEAYGLLPSAERNGYFFLGWFGSTSSLDKTEITADDIYSTLGNKTLYAHWSPARTVTYYANAGADEVTGIPAPQNTDVRYTVPSAIPQRLGYSFVGWAKSADAAKADYKPGDRIPGPLAISKLDEDLDLYAVWEMINTTISIRTPSLTTIKYGDSLVLHAEIGGNLPAGAKLVWSVDNPDAFEMTVSYDGKTCTVTPKKSGTAVFTVKVVDKDGNTLYSFVGPTELTAEQAVTSNAGFFQKLAAFFKKLFKATKVYDKD